MSIETHTENEELGLLARSVEHLVSPLVAFANKDERTLGEVVTFRATDEGIEATYTGDFGGFRLTLTPGRDAPAVN